MGLFEEFGDLRDIVDGNVPPPCCDKPTIILAITPRTGSTHLCAALEAASADHLRPEEVFNPRGIVQNLKLRLGVSTFADYISTLSRRPGPVFMFKASWHDFRPLAELSRAIFPDLRAIYLDRLDIVAQAVSMFRAMTTELWHRHPDGRMGGQVEKYGLMPDSEIRRRFDAGRINGIIANIEVERQGWKGYFATAGIEPVRISYEGFSDDVRAAVEYIGVELGLKLTKTIGPEVGCVKLADEINEEWIARVREFRAGGVLKS